jgi:hypothetical protein
VDNAPVGSTDSAGAFTFDKLSPGEHAIELRNAPQYRSTPFRRAFAARETVTVGPAEAKLERSPATVTITSSPDTAQLDWTCGSRVGRGRGAAAVDCTEAQLTVKASLQGYGEESRTVELSPGNVQSVRLELKRTAAAAPQKKTASCGPNDLLSHGWAAQQEWNVAGNGATFPCNDVPGQYQFTVQLPRGVLAKGVQWVIAGSPSPRGGASIQFVLDKKAFSARGGPKVDLSKYEDNGSVTFLVTVEAGRITHQARANGAWTQVSASEGDFHSYRISFSQGAHIAGFSFREQ